jgi:hypothetical protein
VYGDAVRRLAALLLFVPACSLLFPIDEDQYEGHPAPTPPAGTFCATIDAAFCADFDEGDAADLGWSSSKVDPNSSLALDTSEHASAPASARAIVSPKDRYAILEKSFDSSYRLVSVELDFYLAQVNWSGATGNFTLTDIQFFGRDANQGVASGLVLGPTYFEVTTARPTLTYNQPNDGGGGHLLPMGVWTHLRMDTEPRTKGGTLKVWLGTELVIENDNLDFAEINANKVYLRIGGIEETEPTPPLDVRYDNVVFRLL